MTDRISLFGVGGYGYHGVLPSERKNGQPFTVDLQVSTDLRAAAAADDLSRTIDYSALTSDIVAVIEGEPCRLIETVAERIAQRVLRHDMIQAVEVTVHKPHAPIDAPFSDVTVTVVRER